MTRVSTELELLLKFRQLGAEIIEQTERRVDELADAQDRASASGDRAVRTATEQSRSFAQLRSRVVSLAAGFVSLATARRAIELSDTQERAELRLLGILQAQAGARADIRGEFERIRSLSAELQERTQLFGDEEFLRAAGDLIAAGSDLDESLELLPERLRTAAGAAVVFFEGDLNASVRNLSRTLGGLVGELGERIPALNAELSRLSDEERRRALQAGRAFEIVEQLAGPALDTAQGANFARRQAAANRFGDALEDLGDALNVLVVPSMENLAISAQTAAEFFSALPSQRIPPGALISDANDLASLIGQNQGRRLSAFAQFFENFARPAEDQLVFRPERAAAIESLLERLSTAAVRGADFGAGVSVEQLQRVQARLVALLDRDLNIGEGGVIELRQIERAIAEAIDRATEAAAQGRAAGSASAPPPLLSSEQRQELLVGLGLISEFDAQLASINDEFREIAGTDLSIALTDNLPGAAELDILRRNAIASAEAADSQRQLADAEERFRRAVESSREAAEAGLITESRRRELFAEALAAFREDFALIADDTSELDARVASLLDRLRAISDEDADLIDPETLRALKDDLRDLGLELETLRDDVAGFSSEFGEAFVGPLADVIDQFAQGEATIADFGLAFVDTMRRILAEQAALLLLQQIFGGSGQSIGGGGALGGFFDFLGGFLGFDAGGFVPGPDRGRDDRLIAVRGEEFIVRPEIVRLPGVRSYLEALNTGAVAGSFVPPAPTRRRDSIGYQGGGFVDTVLSAPGASGEARTQVIPAVILDDELAERIFSGRNLDRLAEAMSRRQGAFGASVSSRPGATGGLSQ